MKRIAPVIFYIVGCGYTAVDATHRHAFFSRGGDVRLRQKQHPHLPGSPEPTVVFYGPDHAKRLDVVAKEVSGQLPTGEKPPPLRLQQVFAGYDHDISFDALVPFPELEKHGE